MADETTRGRPRRQGRKAPTRPQRLEIAEYDPLNYSSLARSCLVQLQVQPVHPLPLTVTFRGAGVYALYYKGSLEAYAEYVASEGQNPEKPIYVGKAEPTGGRKGAASGAATQGEELVRRIRSHVRSLDAVDSLSPDEFVCRFLVVVPLWIRMVERFLIEETRPPWNGSLDGFGIHDPGGNRSPIVSWWDAMHPGRPVALGWKAKIQYVRSREQAEGRLRDWLARPESERPVKIDDDDDQSTEDE